VRTGPWKLLMPLRAGAKPELYNLDDDSGEESNVAKEKPAILKKLITAWAEWEADVDLSGTEYNR
jgi:arylsulfatase A